MKQYLLLTNTGFTSGTSGISGSSGLSGTSGTAGTSGTSGSSGSSGWSGGSSGTSGWSGGSSGTSGDGTAGTSGTSGATGTSGISNNYTYDVDFYYDTTTDKLFTPNILVTSGMTIPTSTGVTGTVGQITWNSSYIYVCIATNTWRRATLNGW